MKYEIFTDRHGENPGIVNMEEQNGYMNIEQICDKLNEQQSDIDCLLDFKVNAEKVLQDEYNSYSDMVWSTWIGNLAKRLKITIDKNPKPKAPIDYQKDLDNLEEAIVTVTRKYKDNPEIQEAMREIVQLKKENGGE